MATSKYTLTQQAIEEEWTLIQAAQTNPSRFGVLYNRYYEQIFRFIYQRTADEDLCADLCAQTFIKAMQNLSKYSYKGVPFSAWLYTIASNEIKQYFRKSNKSRVVTLEDNYVNTIKDEMDDKVELEINIVRLEKVLKKLKPDEIQMIELRFFEKRPFKEVGDILGMTENNAKVKVHRIILKLKDLFKELSDD
jgi:RNA polymerase sigma-70 factor (ECF subfamily)